MTTLLLLLAVQDDATKAKELLEEAAAAMKDAATIRFEFSSRWKAETEEVAQKGKATCQRPSLARLETSWDGQDYLYVLDGTTFWMYMKASNQYMKVAQSKGVEVNLGAGIVANLYYGTAKEALADAAEFKVKEEKIGEERVDAVSWTGHGASHRVWIDGKKLVRKYEFKMTVGEEVYEQVFEYGAMDLAPKLEKDAFTFTPPKDATEFKQEPMDESLLAEGSAAPDFEGTDLEGKTVKLSDFKGKTVLLNFWFHG